ncbi:MAG: protein kinase [Polyangiales bacterium]|nr:protein kinase [Myxococcales bacterium]MCB9661804.1 protein kinase [Sandaracinaceae bacterium]
MSASLLQRSVGDMLGERYRIVSVLGEGGFGSVYAADDLEAGRRVAVKCLHAHLAADADVVVRFRREARAATEIGHPGIVEVFDFGALSDGSIVMAMELLEGEDLADKLARDGALRVSDACQLVTHVCAALGAAHAKGIIHRDLKPDNIFLPAGEGAQPIKLLDFGISKFQAPVEGASMMTKTGTAMGTPFYMSPEQAQGKRGIDARADIYSLGVILFRLLTDQHPFEDDSYPMLVLKICTEPPPPVRKYRMDVPVQLDALISKMLSKTPAERPATCADVAAALAPFVTHDVAPVVTPGGATRDVTPSALSRVHSPLALANTAISSSALPHDEGLDLDAEEQRALGGGLRPWMIALIVLVAVAVVGGGLLYLKGPDTLDDPVATVALPTPDEPDIAPLTTPPPTSLGWRFEHPRPRAMPSWRAVAVGGAGLVGVVGNRGQAGRFVSGRLVRWDTGTRADLHGIAWATADSAWVVGEGGLLERLGAGAPEVVRTDTQAALRDVVVVSPTEVVAVGDRGTFLRVVGQRLTSVATGVSETLFGAHARDGVVFAVGQGGLVLRVEGDHVVTERPAGSSTLRAVGGCPRSDLYAVGDDGHVMRRIEDGSWRRVPGTGREGFTGVSCDEGRAAASGTDGNVLLLAGDRSVRLASGTDQPFRDIAGAEGAATWVVGDAGRLALMATDHLILLTEGTSRTLRAAAVLAGRLVVVGEWGTLLREGEHAFSAGVSGTDAALAGLATYRDDTLVAVGDQGVMLAVTWSAVREVQSPTEQPLRAIVAREGWLTAVGARGTVVRGPLEGLSTTTVEGEPTLWAISGTPERAVAVGDRGAVVRLTQTTVTPVRCDEARGLQLRGVLQGETESFAVGVGGAVLRITDGSCTVERAPSEGAATLFTVGLDDEGRVFAAGEDGAAVVRATDGSWTELDLGVDVALFGMLRTDRDVWLVGASGAILRRPRTDSPGSGATGGAGVSG